MLITAIRSAHDGVFGALQAVLENWFLGLAARLIFASTLLVYFWNSALLKTFGREPQRFDTFEPSIFGAFIVDVDTALVQMAPQAYEQAGFDASALGLPYQLMAWGGTYAEFILPALIVVGLFTRLASVGMIVFIAVQTWVDVTGHGTALNLAGMFDRLPSDTLVDQRLLWVFPLVYLVVRGAGAASLDWLMTPRGRRR